MAPRVTKGKGKGKASTSRADEVTITRHTPQFYGIRLPTPDSRERWEQLCAIPHRQCRYICSETIEAMGIAEDIWSLADRGGWRRVITGGWLAYRGLTLEFLSTFQLIKSNGAPSRISFQLGNEPRELTIDELDEILGCPQGGAYAGGLEFNPTRMWERCHFRGVEEIAGYDSRRSKAASLRNPVIRLTQRAFGFTFLGRENVGFCRSNELLLIQGALTNISLSLGCLLADQFESQAHTRGGKICIGGMITPIATHLGVAIQEDPISRDILLDRRCLVQQHFLASGRRLLWILKGDNGNVYFPLPNPALTTIMGPGEAANLGMRQPAHFAATIAHLQDAHAQQHAPEGEEEEQAYEQGGEIPQPPPAYPGGGVGFEDRMMGRFDSFQAANMARFDAIQEEQRRQYEAFLQYQEDERRRYEEHMRHFHAFHGPFPPP